MKSNGQIIHQATLEERKRLNLVVDTQIDIIKGRIKEANNDFIIQCWTVALIELMEVKRITNEPTRGKVNARTN